MLAISWSCFKHQRAERLFRERESHDYGLPAGATATTGSITGSGYTTLQVTATGTAAGVYPLTINAVSGSITHSTPVTLQVNSASGSTLPSPWAHMDIGAVGVQGDASFAAGFYSVLGSGNWVFLTADVFQYAYQPLNGDGTIIAHLASSQNVNGLAKIGLMIRESLTPGSPNVFLNDQGASYTTFQYRVGQDAVTSYAQSSQRLWLKLTRAGNTFMVMRQRTALPGYRSATPRSRCEAQSTLGWRWAREIRPRLRR